MCITQWQTAQRTKSCLLLQGGGEHLMRYGAYKTDERSGKVTKRQLIHNIHSHKLPQFQEPVTHFFLLRFPPLHPLSPEAAFPKCPIGLMDLTVAKGTAQYGWKACGIFMPQGPQFPWHRHYQVVKSFHQFPLYSSGSLKELRLRVSHSAFLFIRQQMVVPFFTYKHIIFCLYRQLLCS